MSILSQKTISKKISLKLILLYKSSLSPYIGGNCKYEPSCSSYSYEAINRFGFFKGLFMSIKRILSCHPVKFLGGGEGLDPVNKEVKDNK